MSKALKNLVHMTRIGYNVFGSSYISDHVTVKRSWMERLFSLPWRPLEKSKTVEKVEAYLKSDGTVLVSLKTMQALEEALLNEDPAANL